MKRVILSMMVVCAVGGAAHANEDKDNAIANLLGALGDAIRWDGPSNQGDPDEIAHVIASCREAIADAKKEGVKPSDTITGWPGWEVNPNAKKSGDKVTFAFQDATWYCDDLAKRTKRWDLIAQIKVAQSVQSTIDKGLDADQQRESSSDLVTAFRGYQQSCTDDLAAVQAKGPDDLEVDGAKIAQKDVPAFCEALGKYADLEQAAWDQKVQTLGAKYSAVGIKGDRLEIFVYYDDLEGWYLKGCKKSTKDPKTMKKAKALFQWLTGDDGVITIRKYAFKGDKYKVTEKQFLTEAKAYKGCK